MGLNLQLDVGVGLAVVFLNVSDFLERYSYDTSCEVKLLLGSPQQHNSENKYGVFSPSPNGSLMSLVSNGEHLHLKICVPVTWCTEEHRIVYYDCQCGNAGTLFHDFQI